MNWFDSLRVAVVEIRRNLLRSALTITGVWIGVAAVIVLVTLGRGATARVTSDVASLGSNLLTVRPGQQQRGPGGVSTQAPAFESEDVTAIQGALEGIAEVCPAASTIAQAIANGRNHSTTVTGTQARFHEVRDWALATGRAFFASEERAGAAVCVLGNSVRQELFEGQNPVGQSIRLGRISLQVIGVLEAKGQLTFGQDPDDVVLVPLRTFQRRLAGTRDIGTIYLSVADELQIRAAQERTEDVLRTRRSSNSLEQDDFSVMDMREVMSTVEVVTGVMTALLGSVAAVSLLVGGIGIMNILLVSVTERTREIGLRLAVGATEGEILMQFLLESVALCVFGGVVGGVIGLLGAAVGANALGLPLIVEARLVFAAMIFALVVGAVFGYMPARRAARLDPIDALRHA